MTRSKSDAERWRRLERITARGRLGALERERDGLRTEMVLYARTHKNFGPDRVVFEGLNERLRHLINQITEHRVRISRLTYEIEGGGL
jgi:hypothetical protein